MILPIEKMAKISDTVRVVVIVHCADGSEYAACGQLAQELAAKALQDGEPIRMRQEMREGLLAMPSVRKGCCGG